MSMMNLTEATMLALQGKLNLEESIVNKNQKLQKDLAKTVSTKKRKSYKTEKRALKKEDISVAVDDTTSVSVSDTETVVNTADAQITITEPATNSEEQSISASDNSVELPITGDETIMPEEITDEPVDTELPTEENKKLESVEIEVSDDGKEVEVTTDNGEEVEVKDETSEEDETPEEDEEEDEEEDTETEISTGDEPSIDEMIEENKKEETVVRDGATNIARDEYQKGRNYSIEGNDECLLDTNKLADFIADVAEEMGDDYSEWFGEEDIKYLIDTVAVSSIYNDFKNQLEELIKDHVSDRVDYIRKDDPASKYHTGDLDESKIVEDTEEYLQPRFDSRNSFYKKAKVVTKDNGDEELYSYGTLVGGIKDGKPYSTGKWSQTTTRHQKEYFKQRGFDPDKVEVTETKKSNKKSDKTFKEFVEAKNKKIEHKDKFSSKTFNKVLTDYFKSKDKAVESVSVTNMFKNNDTMKLEAKLTKVRGTSRDICLEMRKVQSGKSFNKFELTEAKGLKRESKNRSSKVTMMTFTNKQNVLECRYIISK